MSAQYAILTSDSGNTGKKVDLSELTVSAQTVERQNVCLADPTAAAGLATVVASNAATSETATACLRTASSMFALDAAASAGSQQVPLAVESTAQPNLRTSVWQAGNEASVKAASTATTATDKALVVGIHPSSPVTTNADGTPAGGALATKCLLIGGQFLAYGSLPALTTGQGASLQTDIPGNLKVAVAPLGTPIYAGASSGGAGAANATLTIPSGKMGYLDGFDLDGCGATAGSAISVTVTGLLGGTLTFTVGIPAGATVPYHQSFRFNPPLRAAAVNTNIVVNVPSYGSGNTASTTNAYGHYV